MYENSSTSVKSVCEETDNFNVRLGVTLSSYLFSVVINEVEKEIQEEVAWCMMFADNLVLIY